MFHTLRDALVTIRDAIGVRNSLGLAVLALLAAPVILALMMIVLPVWCLWLGASYARDLLQGVGRRLDDPVLGPLTYEGDSAWHGVRELDALGGTYGIRITAPRQAGPGPVQQELLRGLIARQHELRPPLQESLYREYQAVAPQRRNQLGTSASGDLARILREDLPLLAEPGQIWTLLRDGFIVLEDRPGCFSITWNCTWDEEHGVCRTVVDWVLSSTESL